MTGIIYTSLSSAIIRVSSTLTSVKDTALSTTSYVAQASLSALGSAYDVGAYAAARTGEIAYQGAYHAGVYGAHITKLGLLALGHGALSLTSMGLRPVASYLLADKINEKLQKRLSNAQLPSQGATDYLKSKVNAFSKLNPAEKIGIKQAIRPILSQIKWVHNIDSFKALALHAAQTFGNYFGMLQEPSVVRNSEIYLGVMQAYDSAVQSKNQALIKSLGQAVKSAQNAYKESLVHTLGYQNMKSLKKEALRAVGTYAGQFLANPKEGRPITQTIRSFFSAIYLLIVSQIARRILRKKVNKLDQIIEKHYPSFSGHLMKVISKHRGPHLKALLKIQARVFALHAAHSLIEKRGNILNPETFETRGFNTEAQDSLSKVGEEILKNLIPHPTLQKELSPVVLDRIKEVDFEALLAILHPKVSSWVKAK